MITIKTKKSGTLSLIKHYIYSQKKRLAIKYKLLKFKNKRIIVGAGCTRYNGWIPTDERILNLLSNKDWESLFKPDSLDAILGEHVWEHFTPQEAITAASHCFKYLKPGGYLRVAVPDGYQPSNEYINWVRPGGSGPGSDEHKVLYTYESFISLFSSIGFTVSLIEYFDQNEVFHELPWNPMDGMIRRSKRFDKRNADGVLRYTSIIIDAQKQLSQ